MKITEIETRKDGCIFQAFGSIDKYEFDLIYKEDSNFRVCYLSEDKKLVAFEDKEKNKFWSLKSNEIKTILAEIYKFYKVNE